MSRALGPRPFQRCLLNTTSTSLALCFFGSGETCPRVCLFRSAVPAFPPPRTHLSAETAPLRPGRLRSRPRLSCPARGRTPAEERGQTKASHPPRQSPPQTTELPPRTGQENSLDSVHPPSLIPGPVGSRRCQRRCQSSRTIVWGRKRWTLQPDACAGAEGSSQLGDTP